jgi:hypothetical protein
VALTGFVPAADTLGSDDGTLSNGGRPVSQRDDRLASSRNPKDRCALALDGVNTARDNNDATDTGPKDDVDGGISGDDDDDKEAYYEKTCRALWHYVRIILPELEVQPRSPRASVYDEPDRVRLVAFVDPRAEARPGFDSPLSLAYGFGTEWEAGARERAASFLAARHKRRAAAVPRPLARTGWISTRGLKAFDRGAVFARGAHPHSSRDPLFARGAHQGRADIYRDMGYLDRNGGDLYGRDNDTYGFCGNNDRFRKPAEMWHLPQIRSKDDTDLARRDPFSDPYADYETPSALWHRRNPPLSEYRMDIDELDDSDDIEADDDFEAIVDGRQGDGSKARAPQTRSFVDAA